MVSAPHIIPDDELTVITERLRNASTKPWKIDTAFDGDNWLLASLGNSGIDGLDYHITTDHVHASEYDGDAKTDAEFIVWCRNDMARLGNAYVALLARYKELLAACEDDPRWPWPMPMPGILTGGGEP